MFPCRYKSSGGEKGNVRRRQEEKRRKGAFVTDGERDGNLSLKSSLEIPSEDIPLEVCHKICNVKTPGKTQANTMLN